MAPRNIVISAGLALVLALGAAAPLVRRADRPPAPPPAGLGAWSFRAEADGPWRRVTLPHVPQAGPVGGRAGARVDAGGVAWYRAMVRADRPGAHALRVGSANHHAVVRLDGRRVCEHRGAYEPFACVLRLRDRRAHLVELRVDSRSRGPGFDRGWFNWGGLAWPVSLDRLGRSTLADPLVVTRLQRGGAARVEVRLTVRNRAARARVLRVRGSLRRGDQGVALRFGARRLPAGGTAVVRAVAVVEQPALWSPRRPALYRLRAAVAGEAGLRRRAGLRELGWGPDGLRINGRRLRLAGASLPPDARGRGDALRAADHDRLLAGLRTIGANAVRAQFPLSDALLDRLDAAGILVWQHVGPWDPAGAFSSSTPALRAAARRRALATAAREASHPSVLAWNLGNEVAGQGHPAGQAAYVDATARDLHRLDPGRPVAVDVWGAHPPRAAGSLYRRVDVLGVSSYSGWYELAGRPPAEQEGAALQGVAALRAVFPGKPVVVTEFGAVADRRNEPGRPGGERYQADLIGRRVRTLARAPGVAGALVFTLRDYAYRPLFDGRPPPEAPPEARFPRGLNAKGLFRYNGTARPSAAAARRAFAALATS